MPRKKTHWAKKNKPEDLAFVGGLFIGLGIGMITGQVAGGVLIGMGAGFILTMIIKLVRGK